MGNEPERADRDRTMQDGLAAIAIVVLSFALIAVVINHLV